MDRGAYVSASRSLAVRLRSDAVMGCGAALAGRVRASPTSSSRAELRSILMVRVVGNIIGCTMR